MNILSPDMLYDYDYSIKVINALRRYWADGHDSFSSIGEPKAMHMILYLDSCKAEYTLKNGEKLYAESGNLVYAPKGAEYSVKFTPINGGSTVGVNMLLYKDGEEISFSDKVLVFDTDFPKDSRRFEKLCEQSNAAIASPGKMKSIMYDILSDIGQAERTKALTENRFSVIEKGIAYLENDISGKLTIAQIAHLCNVSEIYFRRLFKEYSNLSPNEFRIKSRIRKAKDFLRYDDMTISEITERVGFSDTAYFAKLFKSRVGISPTEYRKKKKK